MFFYMLHSKLQIDMFSRNNGCKRTNISGEKDAFWVLNTVAIQRKGLELAMHDPNVKGIWKCLITTILEKIYLDKKLNVGSCSQYTIHNVFKNNTLQIIWNVHKLLKAMYWILHDSPARRDDNLQEDSVLKYSFCGLILYLILHLWLIILE